MTIFCILMINLIFTVSSFATARSYTPAEKLQVCTTEMEFNSSIIGANPCYGYTELVTQIERANGLNRFRFDGHPFVRQPRLKYDHLPIYGLRNQEMVWNASRFPPYQRDQRYLPTYSPMVPTGTLRL